MSLKKLSSCYVELYHVPPKIQKQNILKWDLNKNTWILMSSWIIRTSNDVCREKYYFSTILGQKKMPQWPAPFFCVLHSNDSGTRVGAPPLRRYPPLHPTHNLRPVQIISIDVATCSFYIFPIIPCFIFSLPHIMLGWLVPLILKILSSVCPVQYCLWYLYYYFL